MVQILGNYSKDRYSQGDDQLRCDIVYGRNFILSSTTLGPTYWESGGCHPANLEHFFLWGKIEHGGQNFTKIGEYFCLLKDDRVAPTRFLKYRFLAIIFTKKIASIPTVTPKLIIWVCLLDYMLTLLVFASCILWSIYPCIHPCIHLCIHPPSMHPSMHPWIDAIH